MSKSRIKQLEQKMIAYQIITSTPIGIQLAKQIEMDEAELKYLKSKHRIK